MKILLLGDASNYHRTLSQGLAAKGHDVTVASAGSGWMKTGRDIDLSRRPGKLSGALLWTKLNTVLSSRLKGYDVVQIHNPIFLDLKPQRVRSIFDKIRRDNGGVFLTALGTDTQYVEMCTAVDNPLRYSEFAVGTTPTPYVKEHPTIIDEWKSQNLANHCRHVYEHIDGAVCALYEYYLSCRRHLPEERVAYGGIPIDTASIPFRPLEEKQGKIRVVAACHKGREAEKGMDVMMVKLKQLQALNPSKMQLELLQNVPFAQLRERIDQAHIIVDQLYAYTPATTALMAMASGKTVISGGEKEYYDFIGETSLRPIINPDPTNIDALSGDIQNIIDHPELLADLGRQGRELVVRHNDAEVVAQRFIDFWERRLK